MNKLQRRVRTFIRTPPIKQLVAIDHKLTSRFHDWVYAHTYLLHLFMAIRVILNVLGLPLFFIIAIKYIANKKLLLKIFIVWLIAEILIELVAKPFFARIRPECKTYNVKIGPFHFSKPKSFSFPSGHSFNAGYIIALTWLLPIPYKMLITLTALLVALSRVALGFHYFIDIFTGLMIGLLLGFLATVI